MADIQSDADKNRTTMASLREKFSQLDGESKELVLEEFRRLLGTGSTPTAASSLMQKMDRLANTQQGGKSLSDADVERAGGKKGGGKVYASQNKKYGGGVYPRKTVGSDD